MIKLRKEKEKHIQKYCYFVINHTLHEQHKEWLLNNVKKLNSKNIYPSDSINLNLFSLLLLLIFIFFLLLP